MYRRITNDQGQAINNYLSAYNRPYDLYDNNCAHVVQQGLRQAGIDFAATGGSDYASYMRAYCINMNIAGGGMIIAINR